MFELEKGDFTTANLTITYKNETSKTITLNNLQGTVTSVTSSNTNVVSIGSYSNSSIKLGDKCNEKKLGNKHEGEKNTSFKFIYKNNANNSVKNKNKANFGNINRANIPSLKRNKTYLFNIFLKKCKL